MGGAPSTAGWRSSRPTRTGVIYILFHEYFHGDNGAGLGASHQTGWTGVLAWIMRVSGSVTDFETAYTTVISRKSGAGELQQPGGSTT